MKNKDLFHSAYARHDIKILNMRSVYGLQGYGLYWCLMERMIVEKDARLPLKDYFFRALAYELKLDIEKVKKFVNDCIQEFELFYVDNNDDYFWTDFLSIKMVDDSKPSNNWTQTALTMAMSGSPFPYK